MMPRKKRGAEVPLDTKTPKIHLLTLGEPNISTVLPPHCVQRDTE